MATKTQKKQRKELLIGAGALALGLAVILLVALLLPRTNSKPSSAPPPSTAPAVTLPPNPYGPSDFQFENGYLTCLAGESVLGIDVSSHQGRIDWQQVKEAGIEFVMIRVGYRGYETGLLNLDEFAQSNYEGAKAAGLQVGAYFFSQALDEEEALAEAEFLLEQIRHWEVDMPVAYDWETVSNEDARTNGADQETVMACTRAFLERIREAGYTPMVYFNKHQSQTLLELTELTDYPFWLAFYSNRMTYEYKIHMWQYTQDGKVPGINTLVDINLWLP